MTLDHGRSTEILNRWKTDLQSAANAGQTSHPTTTAWDELPRFTNQPDDRRSQIEKAWNDLADQHADDPRHRLLSLWRHLRENLASQDPAWAYLEMPGKPHCSVWDHLDTVARDVLTSADGHGPAFLSFSLGPVQSYIAAARSVRDLWTGSYLLAYLTYNAMTPVLGACGPTALVFPSLRGMPLIDDWLRTRPHRDLEAEIEARLTPCLPNRFLAIVPAGENGRTAQDLATKCENDCRLAWSRLAETVRGSIEKNILPHIPHSADWDRFWPSQINTYFEIRSAILPWNEANAEAIKAAIPSATPNDAEPHTLYAPRLALQFGLLEAMRSVRHVPNYEAQQVAKAQRYPQKCTLLGTHEQIGPAELSASRAFWEAVSQQVFNGTRLRPGERFGAVSLVKRFAWPAVLCKKLGLDPTDRRFADTPTIAAREWLREAEIDPDAVWRKHKMWSGQWLFREDADELDPSERAPREVADQIRESSRPRPDGCGPPPTYYAVLAIDGDHMGKWIQGQMLPPGRTFDPEVHNAISAALNHYALHAVPGIVKYHQGELIYAGGDDVLAFFPTPRALPCAKALRDAFAAPHVRDDPSHHTLGGRAAMSGGLVIAHYKEDLRFVLEEARAAETLAKSSGRNALALRILRRSGEHSSVVLPWDALDSLHTLVDHFKQGMTDRWAYALRAELPTLRGLSNDAFFAEALRLVRRVENEDDRKRLCDWVNGPAQNLLKNPIDHNDRHDQDHDQLHAKAIENLVILCQSASFLARGRDDR